MNKNKLVKKSNSLVTARYELPMVEQKLILTLIAGVEREDEDFKEYRFYIKDFFELIKYKEENYTYVKNAFRSLMEKTLEMKTESGGWLLLHWLSSAKSEKGEGYVDVKFDPYLKPYLLKLKQCFTTYELKNILFLHSAYSLRIYEHLKQYEKTGVKNISIDELKDILQIKPHITTGDINQRILKAAQKELKKLTDISFTYNFTRRGNKYTDITFKIKRNSKMPKLLQKSQIDAIDKVPSLQEVAESCYKKGKCRETPILMSYCKTCKNYDEKSIWLKENE